jgi:hypothetical protein
MVTTKLGHRTHLPVAGAVVLGLTATGALLAVVDPALAGTTRPHPTLTGNVSDAVSILANNARVLAAPFLLYLLGAPRSLPGRRSGDIVIAVMVALSTIPVGVELGRWRAQLIPYVPQLPVEWAALTVAVAAWLAARTATANHRDLAALAAVTTGLLVAAAGLETYATPHRTARPAASEATADWIGEVPVSCGCPGVAFATDFAPGRPGHCKVARSLPLTPFGSARPSAGADRALSTTPGPPQGGTTP